MVLCVVNEVVEQTHYGSMGRLHFCPHEWLIFDGKCRFIYHIYMGKGAKKQHIFF